MIGLEYKDLAKRWGVPLSRLRSWKHRGKLPEPDRVIGRSPVWYETTIEELEDRNDGDLRSS